MLELKLRLAKAATLQEANQVLKRYITRYSRQFAAAPKEAELAFQPVPAHLHLEHIFCWKEFRTLNPGYAVHYNRQICQLIAPENALSDLLCSIVEVHCHADGSLSVAWNGYICSLELLPEPVRAKWQEVDSKPKKAGPATPQIFCTACLLDGFLQGKPLIDEATARRALGGV